MLSLILTSEAYRYAFLKVLNESHVSDGISADKFADIMGNVSAFNIISFSDEEMGPEGTGHNKALHLIVKSTGMTLSQVLVDNGSAVNVCPVSTIKRMDIDQERVLRSNTVIQAFDGSRKETIGVMHLPIKIEPYMFQVTFEVLDILTAYNMLLGRPWIHPTRAVPSTLHQNVKYAINGLLVIVHGE